MKETSFWLGTMLLAIGSALPPPLAAAMEGLVYVPAGPCTLVRTAGTVAGRLEAGETRELLARGAVNLAPQGGPPQEMPPKRCSTPLLAIS